MTHIVPDGCAFGRAECVNRAHVTEHAPAKVMDPVKLDLVALGHAGRIPPAPTNRNAGVKQITDVIADYHVIPAVVDPYANCTHENGPVGADDIIIHNTPAGALGVGRIIVGPDFAYPYAICTKAMKVTTCHAAVLTSAPEPDTVHANMRNLAIFN